MDIITNIKYKLFQFLECSPLTQRSKKDKKFDSIEWKRGNTDSKYKMLIDIYRSQMLFGKSIQEVDLILGTPSKSNANTYQYIVEKRKLETRLLKIEFGISGIVESVEMEKTTPNNHI